MGIFIGLIGSIICLAIAYGLTASIDLPTPADVAIWVIAGAYTLSYIVFGVIVEIIAGADRRNRW